MGAQPSPSPAWDDVGPRKDYRRHVKKSRRRQPLRALDGGAKNTDTPIVAAGGNLPSPCSNDVDYVVCVSSEGATKPLEYGQVRRSACLGTFSGVCCGSRGRWVARNSSASVFWHRPVEYNRAGPGSYRKTCCSLVRCVKFFAFLSYQRCP